MINKLNIVNALRGIAAILVVLFHVSSHYKETEAYSFLYGSFLFGYSGVDFFFILSGFIIYYVHNTDIGDRTRISTYTLKRFLRVYPIYWVCAAPILIINFLHPMKGYAYLNGDWTIPLSLLLFPISTTNILPVTWTLNHEILFYILFGMVIFFDKAISCCIILIWLILTFVVSVALPANFDLNYLGVFLFGPFNFEFLIGIFAAMMIVNNGKLGIIVPNILIIVGLTLLLLSIIFDVDKKFGRQIAYSLPYFCILFGAAAKDISQKVVIPSIFKLLGDASYSIYLTHVLSITCIYKILKYFNFFDIEFAVPVIATIVLSIGIGCVVHLYIERPLLNFLRDQFIKSDPVYGKNAALR